MPPKAKPDYDIDALFEGIESNPRPPSTSATTSKIPLSSSTISKPTEKDLLAELDSLAVDRPASISRPTTPRLRAQGTSASPVRRSIEKSRTGPRSSGEGYGINTGGVATRDSGDFGSKGGTPIEPPAVNVTSPTGDITTASNDGGGGWWGSVWSTASAAVKTAEGVYKELQKSEEAKKWTEQVKNVANVDTIQKLGGELRSRALPTLSNILHTIVPPISSHEQLRIHITHDITNYPSIDTIIYGTFDRIMQQVEGGDLLVVQRGGESKPRSSLGSGFNSGPWYKGPEKRDLNACVGFEEGSKLAKAAAEAYAQEHLQKHPKEEEIYNPDNPTRKSDIFLAIQPALYPSPVDSPHTQVSVKAEEGGEEADVHAPEIVVSFALYLFDPVHGISFATSSQALPAKWLEWIDASSGGETPEDIAPIINRGGIDPREWVVEWIEETLGLAVGIVAQRYVARRMHIGESVEGKGKEVEEVMEGFNREKPGVGEEARAGAL